MNYTISIKPLLRACFTGLLIFLLASCAAQPVKISKEPESFKNAVRTMAASLIKQILKKQGQTRKNITVLHSFTNPDTSRALAVHQKIEAIFSEQAKLLAKKKMTCKSLTTRTLKDADFIINGIIRRLSNTSSEYILSASVINLKKGRVIARSDVRFKAIDFRLIPGNPMFQENPVSIKDPHMEVSAEMAQSPLGTIADEEYFSLLETRAMISEAEKAYANGFYRTALVLLNMVAEREDGQLIKTYGGIYSACRKIGLKDQAKKAFEKLISISVEKYRVLTIRFLFRVNSVKFWNNADLVEQYDMWLALIGKYFSKNPYCLKIIGHCSNTGSERYNKDLSMERAQKIQNMLKPYFPEIKKQSTITGKGFLNNLSGSGTDDIRDVLDRRVDFAVEECR